VQGANAEGTLRDLRTKEEVTSLVGFWLRDVPDPGEVKLLRIVAAAGWYSEEFTDWRIESATPNCVSGSQVRSGHVGYQHLRTVGRAAYKRAFFSKGTDTLGIDIRSRGALNIDVHSAKPSVDHAVAGDQNRAFE
jgi:hypothetical protein